jgi:hypothetical protein
LIKNAQLAKLVQIFQNWKNLEVGNTSDASISKTEREPMASVL